jgi:hypothetical protein
MSESIEHQSLFPIPRKTQNIGGDHFRPHKIERRDSVPDIEPSNSRESTKSRRLRRKSSMRLNNSICLPTFELIIHPDLLLQNSMDIGLSEIYMQFRDNTPVNI